MAKIVVFLGMCRVWRNITFSIKGDSRTKLEQLCMQFACISLHLWEYEMPTLVEPMILQPSLPLCTKFAWKWRSQRGKWIKERDWISVWSLSYREYTCHWTAQVHEIIIQGTFFFFFILSQFAFCCNLLDSSVTPFTSSVPQANYLSFWASVFSSAETQCFHNTWKKPGERQDGGRVWGRIHPLP